MMAIVYTNSLPTGEDAGETDQTFCRPFCKSKIVHKISLTFVMMNSVLSASCFNNTDCASNLIYKRCRNNLFGNKQCCL